MIVQENEQSNETDENYVKPFINWNVNDINDYNIKQYGPKGTICSLHYFVILSKEGASEGMFDICINNSKEKKLTVHKVRFELGSTCLINIDLCTLEIEVSRIFWYLVSVDNHTYTFNLKDFEPPYDKYLLE